VKNIIVVKISYRLKHFFVNNLKEKEYFYDRMFPIYHPDNHDEGPKELKFLVG
jgi:hypothetical protein